MSVMKSIGTAAITETALSLLGCFIVSAAGDG